MKTTYRRQQTNKFEEYRSWTGTLVEIDMAPSSCSTGIEVDAWFYDVGTVRFNNSRVSGVRMTRPIGLVRRSTPDIAWMRLCRAGSNRMDFGNRVFDFTPGAIQLGDYSKEMDATAKDLWHVGATMPFDLIGYKRGRHPSVIDFDPNGPVGRTISSAIETQLKTLRTANEQDSAFLALGFCGMMRGLLDGAIGTLSEPLVQVPRKHAMRSFLNARLTEPGLGVNTLIAEFGASRSTVYRDFAVDGGVDAYIRSRRLACAYDELARSPGERGLVSRVAEKWHFSSVGHFSQTFQQVFSCRPGSVVGSNRGGVD